jgi:hypothetical protein
VDSETRTKKERFRKYSPELGLLLWAVWDPIGAGVPLDEYESYVPIVWKLLAERSDVDEIAERLDKIADERMGVAPGRGRAAAERLSNWWYWRFDFPGRVRSAFIVRRAPSASDGRVSCHLRWLDW